MITLVSTMTMTQDIDTLDIRPTSIKNVNEPSGYDHMDTLWFHFRPRQKHVNEPFTTFMVFNFVDGDKSYRIIYRMSDAYIEPHPVEVAVIDLQGDQLYGDRMDIVSIEGVPIRWINQ